MRNWAYKNWNCHYVNRHYFGLGRDIFLYARVYNPRKEMQYLTNLDSLGSIPLQKLKTRGNSRNYFLAPKEISQKQTNNVTELYLSWIIIKILN